MAEQEEYSGWTHIHQLMFDYLKHLGYDDTVVEEFKKRCLFGNYPYFKPLEDWIFFPISFPDSSSGTVPYGKANMIETTGAPVASSSVSAVDIPHELVDPDNFPNSSSGTVPYGKVNTIDPTKINTLVSGEGSLGEEFGKVTSNETTGAPLASALDFPLDIPIDIPPDIPYELLDPEQAHRFGELLGSPPRPSDPSLN